MKKQNPILFLFTVVYYSIGMAERLYIILMDIQYLNYYFFSKEGIVALLGLAVGVLYYIRVKNKYQRRICLLQIILCGILLVFTVQYFGTELYRAVVEDKNIRMNLLIIKDELQEAVLPLILFIFLLRDYIPPKKRKPERDETDGKPLLKKRKKIILISVGGLVVVGLLTFFLAPLINERMVLNAYLPDMLCKQIDFDGIENNYERLLENGYVEMGDGSDGLILLNKSSWFDEAQTDQNSYFVTIYEDEIETQRRMELYDFWRDFWGRKYRNFTLSKGKVKIGILVGNVEKDKQYIKLVQDEIKRIIECTSIVPVNALEPV